MKISVYLVSIVLLALGVLSCAKFEFKDPQGSVHVEYVNSDNIAGEKQRRSEPGDKTQQALNEIHSPGIASADIGSLNFGKYFALVIGINNYGSLPKLKTAIHDAEEVSRVLKQHYGFKVSLLKDAKRADILTSLGELRGHLGRDDNLLIYYAGHGWLDTAADEGYWLPADATQENELNWVSNAFITSTLKALQAKHVLVVADSCYSGKLARGLHIIRTTPDYLRQISSAKARIVLSSGGMEPVLDSGADGHSVFARAFLRVLRENSGILDGTSLFTQVRRPVMLNSDQTPEYADVRRAGHEGGDFLFVRRQ